MMRFILCLFAALLTACAQQPIVAPSMNSAVGDFSLEARILIKHDNRADTLRMSWTHTQQTDALEFASPLGQIMAQLNSSPQGASWKDANGKIRHAPNAETLLAQLTEEPIPLQLLASWVRAQPSAQARILVRDNTNRVIHFADGGWYIRILAYADSQANALPATLEVSRGDIQIRLAIESWQ